MVIVSHRLKLVIWSWHWVLRVFVTILVLDCDQWWWIGYMDGIGYAGGCSFEGTKAGFLSHAVREHSSMIFYIGAYKL